MRGKSALSSDLIFNVSALIGVAALCAMAAAAASGCDPCSACPTTPVSPTSPHFVLTGPMTDSRIFHTGTLLDNGQVLVAGGSQIAGTLDVAEIYNPSAGTFTATSGSMTQARQHHTATLLNDGTVLLAGGDNGGGLLTATAFLSAELYDPTADKFKVTGAMFAPRTWHTATRLADGKVLVAGGSPAVDSTINPITMTGSGLPVGALPNAELYDPASSQFFGNPGPMNAARTEHAAVLIKGCGCTADNEVLLAGGIDASGTTLTSAELFNESKNSFTSTGSMNVARHNHTATTLQDGRVLITGGVDNSLNLLGSAEIYDPNAGSFSFTATPMIAPRAFHSAQLLSDGRVLITGGSDDNSAEIFDPATDAFSATGKMKLIRFEFPSVELPSGAVLIPGGALLLNTIGVLIPGSSLDTAEVFSPSGGTFSFAAQTMVRARVGHTGTALNNNNVLIAGGADLTRRIFDTSELYDPAAGAFTCIGGTTGRDCSASLHDVRFSQTATPLKGSTQVLIAGGSDGETVATAEIYNAASKTYTCVGGISPAPPICNDSMVSARINHVAVALQSGEVLLAGGVNAAGDVISSAELYNPAAGTFSATGSMSVVREQFAAALFTSGPLAGQVLVTGGSDAPGHFLASAELYDPATGIFTPTGSMSETRFLQIEVLLTSGPNSGDMLVAGGSGDQTAELYDPSTRSFKPAGDLTQIVFDPIVATLSNNDILFAGGATFNSEGQIVPISGVELYDPTTNRFTTTNSMTTARWLAAGAFLDPSVLSGSEAGDVLIAGGLGVNSVLASSELFIPGSSTSTASAVSTAASTLPPLLKQQDMAQALNTLRGEFGSRVGGRFWKALRVLRPPAW
ncbi:MAG TPA: kelch repeat-containing protein [Candidatus Binataceae bacterium]|nr:kelch repeat-containing protein [Candidatus Binataceae bacterium]